MAEGEIYSTVCSRSVCQCSFKMHFALLLGSLILGSCGKSAIGSTMTSSPMTVAPVCRVGDTLNLTCTAYVELIIWSFTVVNQQGRDEEITKFISYRARANQTMAIEVNSTTFTLRRISTQGTLPLISTLSIDSVSIGLNGTVVNCVNAINSTSTSTTIQIIDTSNCTLTMRVISEEYLADNVTVTMEWTQQVHATYNVTVVPPVPIVSTGSTSCQLTIPYNTEYNFSIEAVAPCRSNTVTFSRLYYVSCGTPETHNSVNYSSYNSTVEGATVTFWCSDNNDITTKTESTSKCLKNASWTPDPVRQCRDTTLIPVESDDKELDSHRPAVIVGSSFGALAAFLVIVLVIAVGAVYIKRDSLSNHRKTWALNTEPEEEHTYYILVHNQQNNEIARNIVYTDTRSLSNDRSQLPAPENVHDQHNEETAETIVYTNVGLLPNIQSQFPENSLDFDEHRVEYAQLNHKAQASVPTLMKEKSTDEDIALSLDSLLIQLQDKVTQEWHVFGIALGIEKEVLDCYLNYPPEQSIVEILDHWLRKDVEPTLGEIAKALKQINHHKLAEEIESIDETGKLLIEVNVEDVPSDALHRSQFDILNDDEPPPPIPPKRFKEDPEESQ